MLGTCGKILGKNRMLNMLLINNLSFEIFRMQKYQIWWEIEKKYTPKYTIYNIHNTNTNTVPKQNLCM